MIIDTFENSKYYGLGDTGKTIFDFLTSLDKEAEEKRYEIDGDNIFAMVMSYDTRTIDEAAFEAHEKYIDVQAVLDGAEGFQILDKSELEISVPYDEEKEVEFYKPATGTTQLDLYPGSFVLLFPHDAHMPTLIVGSESQYIKKVVVKVKKELLMG